MSIDICRISSRSEYKQFLSLPFRIYRDDPHWVPQILSEVRRSLDTHRNPYFANASLALFLGYRDGIPTSRVAVVVNHRYQKENGHLPSLFGFFESKNDPDVVSALFRTAGAWCSARGSDTMHGPFHPHHYSEMGLQLTGHDSVPSFFQTHHPAYYESLLGSCGFAIERIIHTRRNPNIREHLRQHGKVSLPPNGLRIRPIRYDEMPSELERIREVFNDAFSDNCYFLPLTKEEYVYASAPLKLVTRPNLNVIVEHEREPVGVLQCVLDINPLLSGIQTGRPMPWDVGRFFARRSGIRRLIVYTVGIKKRWQRTRVHVLLHNALADMAADFDELETTWTSSDNPMSVQAAERFGLVQDKQFGIFRRSTRIEAGVST